MLVYHCMTETTIAAKSAAYTSPVSGIRNEPPAICVVNGLKLPPLPPAEKDEPPLLLMVFGEEDAAIIDPILIATGVRDH